MATLFDMKNVQRPSTLRRDTPFNVSGDLTLFGIPYLAPLWVVASVTYPKQFWEVMGAPQAIMGTVALGGKFSLKFEKGLDRDGEYTLDVRAFLGPTQVTSAGPLTGTTITIPPVPPVAGIPEAKFTVAGAGGIPLVGSTITFAQPLVNGQVQPHGIAPNAPITIDCTVTNPSDQATTISGHVDVFQENPMPVTQGVLIRTLPFSGIALPANGTAKIRVMTTADDQARPKQIRIFVTFPDGSTQQSQLFNNAFYVEAGTVAYPITFAQPLINGQSQPRGITPGQSITIQCPITNPGTQPVAISGHVDVFQESGVPQIQGSLIRALPFSGVTLPANATTNVEVTTTADDQARPKQIRIFVTFPDGSTQQSQLFNKAFYVEVGPPVLPRTGDIVTFSVWVDGLPFLTGAYLIYYYDPDGVPWADDVVHAPGDVVTFSNVPTGGYLSVIPQNRVTGEWGEQAYSQAFVAEDGRKYKYDVAGTYVYYA